MSRMEMRMKLLEQMVLDRDQVIEELKALAVPHDDYVALSAKCARMGDLLRACSGSDYVVYSGYRDSVRRDIHIELSQ